MVNDRYGHQAGDRVLCEVTSRIRSAIRTSDLLCRIGGEEFAVVLPETNLEGALAVAERIRAAVAMPWPRTLPHVTVSGGVGCLSPSCATLDAIMDEADGALYRAKAAGRNRISAGDGLPVFAQLCELTRSAPREPAGP